MPHKPTKSVSKRIKFTKNGKLIRRPLGVNHFKTRKSKSNLRDKRKSRKVSSADSKNVSTY
jgi:ribosomal protein L35